MSERQQQIPEFDDQPKGDTETAFEREGPEPAAKDTGENVEEMNKAAFDAVITNVEPHQQVD